MCMKKAITLFKVILICITFLSCSKKTVQRTDVDTTYKNSFRDTGVTSNKVDSINTTTTTTALKDTSFQEFADNFIRSGIQSLNSFKINCENKIKTMDFDIGEYTMESPSKSYDFLKYYFKSKRFKIKKQKIDFSVEEFTVTLYFRKNSTGEWKLYKYDGVC